RVAGTPSSRFARAARTALAFIASSAPPGRGSWGSAATASDARRGWRRRGCVDEASAPLVERLGALAHRRQYSRQVTPQGGGHDEIRHQKPGVEVERVEEQRAGVAFAH